MPKKFKPLKYREVIRILKNLDFQLETCRGSHQTWTHQAQNGVIAVTVPFHGSNIEFKPGTLKSIIQQSRVDIKKFYGALT